MGFFKPSREDGRSDRRVVFELVEHAEPDTMFTHDHLNEALSEGLDFDVEQDRVYRAVAQGNKTLLKERKRYLTAVQGKGYRVIHARESVSVALDKKSRSDAELKRAQEVLDHTRLDELDAEQRKLHEGQRLITAGLIAVSERSDRRHENAESLIADLTSRVERLEGGSE